MNIPWRTVKSIIKYGTAINLSRAGRPQKLGEKRGRPMTSLKEMRAKLSFMKPFTIPESLRHPFSETLGDTCKSTRDFFSKENITSKRYRGFLHEF